MLIAAIPVIYVSDSARAEEFYCKGLGFDVKSRWRPPGVTSDPCYLTVQRDGISLHLASFKDGTLADGTWTSNVYVFVDDVNAMHEELLSRGIAKPSGPLDQTWGTREIGVRDADLNVITFGQRISA